MKHKIVDVKGSYLLAVQIQDEHHLAQRIRGQDRRNRHVRTPVQDEFQVVPATHQVIRLGNHAVGFACRAAVRVEIKAMIR
jgi:translation initiation factor IF-1